jgi:hypothetical protein
MDDFIIYDNYFDTCLENLTLIFKRFMKTKNVILWLNKK